MIMSKQTDNNLIEQTFGIADEKIHKQFKLFINESGKYLAAFIFTIISLIAAGNEVAQTELLPLILVFPIIVAVLILWLGFWWYRHSKRKQRSQLYSIAVVLNTLQDDITSLDTKLRGRISALEKSTNDLICEMSLTTGEIIHANKNWIDSLGWTITAINTEIRKHQKPAKPQAISELLFEKDFIEQIKKYLTDNLYTAQPQSTKFEYVWMKARDGRVFPTTITIQVIKDNGDWVAHYYITDIEEHRSLTERVAGLEDLVQSVVADYAARQSRFIEIKRYTNFLKSKIKEDIKNE